jgi:PAS domain S-box-containing protein
MTRERTEFQPLSTKVALVFGFTSLVGALLVLVLSYLGAVRSIYKSAEDRVSTLADSIVYNASVLTTNQDYFSLSRLVEKSATLQDVVFIAVTDVHGKIIAHNDQYQIGKTLVSPLISQAVESQAQQKSINNTHISFVLPLHGPSFSPEYHDVNGALWVEMDFQPSLNQVQWEYFWSGIGGALWIIVVFPLLLLATRMMIIKRLLKINTGVEQVEAGDLTTRIEVERILRSDDEINLLADRFNHMTTSLQQSQLDLQNERDFALQVMNAMGQGLTIMGAEGILIYVNPAFANLLLSSPENLIGRKLKDYSDLEEFDDKLQLVQQMGTATFETRLMRTDGEWANVLVSAVQNKVNFISTGIIAVITDLTERARLEQMKTDFVNRASHELRTPLTTASIMVQLLDQEIQGEESRGFWEILKDSLLRQQGLVEGLLTLGRIEGGRYKLSIVPIDLTAIVKNVIEKLQPNLDANHLSLTVSIETDLPLVCGDTQALSDVVTNLLTNAIKFSNLNGDIKLQLIKHPQFIHLIIEDEGIGIPAEDLPNLFMRFYRARNATENEIQGSGLGLFIVKSIVTELGGDIQVDSTLGKGTRFTVILPECQETSSENFSTTLQ